MEKYSLQKQNGKTSHAEAVRQNPGNLCDGIHEMRNRNGKSQRDNDIFRIFH